MPGFALGLAAAEPGAGDADADADADADGDGTATRVGPGEPIPPCTDPSRGGEHPPTRTATVIPTATRTVIAAPRLVTRKPWELDAGDIWVRAYRESKMRALGRASSSV